MYARVATFEHADPAKMQESIDAIRGMSDAGPPPGVVATELLMLADRAAGKTLAIVLFPTEADMRAGHEVFNAMDPAVPDGMGKRTSVEMYEVAVQMRV